jgi:ABC-type Fe3+-siderophore transport system permease subunit
MKILVGGAAMMILIAGVIAEVEPKPSPLSVFFMAGVGGTFTSLATYLLAGKKNDSHSLASHLLGNVGIACSLGGMTSMHLAPKMTGIPGGDVYQTVFIGAIFGISGMALIGGIRGMLTTTAIKEMIARALGLEMPVKGKKKAAVIGDDDTK